MDFLRGKSRLLEQSPSRTITLWQYGSGKRRQGDCIFGPGERVAPFGSLSSTTRGTSTDSRRYRRLSTLDLNRASEAAAFATMGVWRLATVPLHPRFGADQKPKRSCSLRASKNRSRHRVKAFGVWRLDVRPHVAVMRKLLHIAFGVLKH
jgi:hypothetical protein